MPVESPNALSRHLRFTAGLTEPDPTDGLLLARFTADRNEAAFAELVRRHGPLVLGVCRRIAGNVHDADDAFQATFLVLARKAQSLEGQAALGGWLYGVAHRAALKGKARETRRRANEAAAARPEGVEVVLEQADALAVIEDELGRLPKKYREPLVLCALCGRSRKGVADELRVPEGTLASRLATARTMLAERLRRRGLVAPAAAGFALGEGTTSAAPVPAALAEQAVKVATGAVPVAVGRIATGVTRAMLLNKFRTGVFVLAVVAVAGAVALGSLSRGAAPPLPAAPTVPAANRTEKPAEIKTKELQDKVTAAKKDLEGVWERQKQAVDDKEVELGLGYYRYTFAERTLHIEVKHIGIKPNGREEITADVELNYTINPTTTPPQLTVYSKDTLQMSIYEISGDALKIARHVNAELERPQGFALKDKRVADLPLTVWEFTRKK